MPITERKLDRSTSISAASERFLDEVSAWIHSCMAGYAREEPGDASGQLTYTSAWAPYLRARPSPEVMAFLAQRRDAVRDRFVRREQWRHGYWRMQEVRHGTEHFVVFLSFLARLNPEDANTARAIAGRGRAFRQLERRRAGLVRCRYRPLPLAAFWRGRRVAEGVRLEHAGPSALRLHLPGRA